MNRLFLLLAACGLLACSDGIVDGDATVSRDSALLDGGMLLDGGPAADASTADSGSYDGGPPLCAVAACDPRTPSACATGSCVLWNETLSCETATGGLAPSAACTQVDECAPGLACFRTDVGGTCGSVCCPGDTSACVTGLTCGGSGVLIDGTETSWRRCLASRTCDLNNVAATCEVREACYIVGDFGETECRVAGARGVGNTCVEQEDCAGGFFCGGLGTLACIRICRIGEDDCPSEEGRCVAQVHTPPGHGLCTRDTTSAL